VKVLVPVKRVVDANVRVRVHKILPKANAHLEMLRSGASGASALAVEPF